MRSRKRKPTMRPEVGEEMARRARQSTCAACGHLECRPVVGHHVLYQQWLISAARTLRIDPVPLLEDERGWLNVGDRCHSRHHDAFIRISRDALREHCPFVFEFAAELNLTGRLERTYPKLVVA